MSAAPACPAGVAGPGEPPPGRAEPDGRLQACAAESASPLPSSADLLLSEVPDSSTSPRLAPPGPLEEAARGREEGKAPARKQKVRTVFSQTQLCVLNDRFQRQKYLSLQQMQELSSLLNLSYKQVKTWFQNQRMKCKRWQKSNWPKHSAGGPQKGPAHAEYPGLCSSYAQGCLVNTSGNLPVWGSQSWSGPGWSGQSWSTQTWYPQTWSSPFPGCGEESPQPCLAFPQNFPASDLEATLDAVGDSHKYFNTPQALDLFLNYPTNLQPEEL